MLKPLSIGMITGLGDAPRERLQALREVDLAHFQWQYAPSLDTPSGRAEILAAAKNSELAITTVFCGYAGESYADIAAVRETVGLVPPKTRARRLETTLKIADCAHKLGVSRVALHLGFIPETPGDPDFALLIALTQQLADELAARGQNLAFETGQETARALRGFLEAVQRTNTRVNFDPANMILYGNDAPLEALPLLAPWLDEVHCKDGRWPTRSGQLGHETPWGEGDVGADQWLAALLATGFRGPLTIERETRGPQQLQDVAAAKKRIEAALSKGELA